MVAKTPTKKAKNFRDILVHANTEEVHLVDQLIDIMSTAVNNMDEEGINTYRPLDSKGKYQPLEFNCRFRISGRPKARQTSLINVDKNPDITLNSRGVHDVYVYMNSKELHKDNDSLFKNLVAAAVEIMHEGARLTPATKLYKAQGFRAVDNSSITKSGIQSLARVGLMLDAKSKRTGDVLKWIDGKDTVGSTMKTIISSHANQIDYIQDFTVQPYESTGSTGGPSNSVSLVCKLESCDLNTLPLTIKVNVKGDIAYITRAICKLDHKGKEHMLIPKWSEQQLTTLKKDYDELQKSLASRSISDKAFVKTLDQVIAKPELVTAK